ncbi:hypothetical protein [Streptomyces litchfieldiae]|uniref:Uncharacterized protein n=1 Tax=Streptomyces litchfieldiae TaxID=3075543 RepID=A0ABU2MT71_9ACTN|nr:hypothetical protein [Streptomyces sp. DSM 44938]MDT0344518.1 hypothetical protein [Streptomyces sp. DSM 44938]
MDDRPVTLLRREDMVALDFSFTNISRTGDPGAETLVVTDQAAPAFLSVGFPPQAIQEEATGPEDTDPRRVKRSRLAEPSRLVLLVPGDAAIPFTAAALLAWTGLETSADQSSLECVWGLTFAPALPGTRWRHQIEPVTSVNGVTELWHTSLAEPGAPGPVPLRTLGAFQGADPFVSSLDFGQRQGILQASAIRPVLAKELTLSALGATVDLTGDWRDTGSNLVGYTHRALFGRDSDVHVVQLGYLLPFGFPVQLATHTVRELEFGLFREQHLTVLRPEIVFDDVPGRPKEGRAFPFRRVLLSGPLTSLVTQGDPLPNPNAGFWINGSSGGELEFLLTAEDHRGHTVTFGAPAVFVHGDFAFGDLRDAAGAYDARAGATVRPAAGRITLVPAAQQSDTTVEVTGLRIGALPAEGDSAAPAAAGRLSVFPRLAGFEARVPALSAFPPAGSAGDVADVVPGLPRPVAMELEQTYVDGGLAASDVFARLENAVGFAPPPVDAGGVAALSMPISGLSTAAGLVGGDIDRFKQEGFKAASYFLAGATPDLPLPKLLGFLPLAELVEDARLGDGEAVPRVLTEVLPPPGNPPVPPESVRTTITWRPKVKTGPHGPLRTNPNTSLDLRSTTLTHLANPAAAHNETRGELRDFELGFVDDLLVLRFEKLVFTARSGVAPALDVKVAEVRFGGDLRFLESIQRLLPSPPNGLRLHVDQNGIEAGYTLAVPTVGMGVFMLQNLALSASVRLPFDGTAVSARFAVSSRQHPFLVTVSLFGGGGFLAIGVQSDKITELEAQLEFGAAAALNLGVASGSVAVTAGVYISFRPDVGAWKVHGFFRAVGELDVLGVITISAEFYLGLTYDGATDKVHGVARLTVRVRVAFFSQAVTLEVERSFGGGNDPAFTDAFATPDPWLERCAAFAAMEAA